MRPLEKPEGQISMDSLLILTTRALLRSLPLIFEEELPYWNYPDEDEDDIEKQIKNIFTPELNAMMGSDLALFEIFHLLQYTYSYVFRVEYVSKVDQGVAWNIYLQSDNYSDFLDSDSDSPYTEITHAFYSLVEASTEIAVAYHVYHQILDELKSDPATNLNGDPSIRGNELIAHGKVSSLMLSAKAKLNVMIDRLIVASKMYGVEDTFKGNLNFDIEILLSKHIKGYNKDSFFCNKHAIELANSPLYNNEITAKRGNNNLFYNYMRNNSSKCDVWLRWFKDRVGGAPISSELTRLLTDIPERLDEASVEEKHAYLKKVTDEHFKITSTTTKSISKEKYQVAVSFAGEDRSYVHEFSSILRDLGISVFYDEFEKTDLWGKNLYQHLSEIYKNQCNFCVIFISKSYARKAWTKHELASAQTRAFKENREYILPVRFDDTKLPGVEDITGYLDGTILTPKELAELTLVKINEHGPLREYKCLTTK